MAHKWFNFTSGRWLYNEAQELASRYRPFNVDALKRAAVACTGAERVDDMQLLGEGRYNRAFRLRLSDAREVVARLPLPVAGPPHLVTASEVATMKFLRNRLNLPVPRILGWSSRIADTPVGAEYIIMEMADGIPLHKVWAELSVPQRGNVVYAWFNFEKTMIAILDGTDGYGSLYLRGDIPHETALPVVVNGREDTEFVLGPSTHRSFWENGRDELDINRGPWRDIPSYLMALSAAERAFISSRARPPPFDSPLELPARIQNPAAHLRLLELHDHVAHYFIHPDAGLHRSTLSHGDVHAGNIFLASDAFDAGKMQISAVIDWQHTSALPLYLQVDLPGIIHLPARPDEPPDEVQREKKFLEQVYRELYTRTKTDIMWAAVLRLGREEAASTKLPKYSARCWGGGYVMLKDCLVDIQRNWASIGERTVGVPCPLDFSEEEIAQHPHDLEALKRVAAARAELDEALGMGYDSWVPHAVYDEVMDISAARRDAWLAGLAREAFKGQNPADRWPYPLE